MPTTSKAQRANPTATEPERFNAPDTTWEALGFAEFPIVTTSFKKPPFSVLEFVQELGEDDDGNPIKRLWKLKSPEDPGLPRLPDLDVFIAILTLLQETSYQKRTIFCSLKDVCDIVGLKRGGTTYAKIRDGFQRFAECTYTSDQTFIDPKTKQKIDLETWEIIVESRFTQDDRGHILPCYFEVSKRFLRIAKDTQRKPLDLTMWRKLPMGLEKPLFHYLDKNLYQKGEHSIGLKKLSERIGLTRSYGPAQLRRLYRKPLETLVDLGFLERFTFEEARSRTDRQKLVVFKARKPAVAVQIPIEATQPPEQGKQAPAAKNEPATQDQAADLVRQFHELISSQRPETLDRTELARARKLLKLQGSYELARYTVDFAVRAGHKTGFDMQNFGAVLANNYPGSARTEYEAERRRREEAQRRQEQTAAEARAEAWLDEQWEQLSHEDRQVLEDKVRPAATKEMGARPMNLSDDMHARLLARSVEARARHLHRRRLEDAGQHPS